jgi:hypothetical protein
MTSFNLKRLHLNVETLLSETEYKLGLHFKICNLFRIITENNQSTIQRYDKQEALEPLRLFTMMHRIKELKDKLIVLIKEADEIVIGR